VEKRGQSTFRETYSDPIDAFQLIGLPCLHFTQDRNSANGPGHNQIDLYDETYEEDLKLASVVLASFLYHAAMRDERMLIKPEPAPVLAPE
jgi:carboxypeptidase Q